jgi:pyruvate formate lyase activating enzyme
VLDEIATYADFLRHAHGGVTLSGGEPLVQPEFAAAVLRGCKELGLHTALDTSGFLGSHADDFLLADTDLVLLDIKCFDAGRYHALTGGDLAPTLAFAERLAALRTPVWLRYVLVPGLTDDPGPIAGLADFAAALGNVERVEILPFHKMGEYKWQAMNLTYTLADTEPPGIAETEAVRDLFRARGLVAT